MGAGCWYSPVLQSSIHSQLQPRCQNLLLLCCGHCAGVALYFPWCLYVVWTLPAHYVVSLLKSKRSCPAIVSLLIHRAPSSLCPVRVALLTSSEIKVVVPLSSLEDLAHLIFWSPELSWAMIGRGLFVLCCLGFLTWYASVIFTSCCPKFPIINLSPCAEIVPGFRLSPQVHQWCVDFNCSPGPPLFICAHWRIADNPLHETPVSVTPLMLSRAASQKHF